MKLQFIRTSALLFTCQIAWAGLPDQRELALRTWQSQNLAILAAETMDPRMTPYPATSMNEIARRYSSMVNALKKASKEGKCEIQEDRAATASVQPDQNVDLRFRVSGSQCPIFYEKISSRMGLIVKYQVNDPYYQTLNEVVGEQIELLSGGKLSSGEILSRSLGRLPFTLRQNFFSNGEPNRISSVHTISFPRFVSELRVTTTFGNAGPTQQDGYFLNEERLSEEEVNTYIQVYPLLQN